MADFARIEQLPVDDWADQDLLTKDEARERLVPQIERARRQLDQLLQSDDPANHAEILLLTRRLNAMESLCGEYDDYLDGK